MDELVRKHDGYYDKFNNWFPFNLIEQKPSETLDDPDVLLS